MPDIAHPRLRSRRGLLFMVLPAIVVMAVLGAVLAILHWRSTVDDRRAETEALAVGAATNARRYFDDQVATLATAAAAPGVRVGDLRRIRPYVHAIARTGNFSTVAYADRSLRVRATSGPARAPVNLRAREYARAALHGGHAVVSPVVLGLTTGRPVLVFAQPIMRADRRRTGVLTGGVELDKGGAVVNRLRYTRQVQETVTIVDARGHQIVGKELVRRLEAAPAGFALADWRRRKQGIADDVRSDDGRQLVAYATVPGLPWLAVVERDYGAVLGELDNALIAELLCIALLALLATLVTLLAARRLDRLDAERDAALDEQRTIAVRLQRSLLPDLPAPASVQVYADYTPAAGAMAVGGDWYDVDGLDDGRVAVSMGDVAGHGLPAAAVMGQLRSAVRMLALGRHEPAEAISRLDAFARTLDGRPLATVVFAVLDPASGELRYACAGHPPPLVLRADGSTAFLPEGRSPLLGVDFPEKRPLGTVVLRPGDTLILYTDGLVERPDRSIDAGLSAMARTAAATPRDPEALAAALLAEVEEPRRDDAAVLCLRLVPERTREPQPSSVPS